MTNEVKRIHDDDSLTIGGSILLIKVLIFHPFVIFDAFNLILQSPNHLILKNAYL